MLSQWSAIFYRQIVVRDIKRAPTCEFVADQRRRVQSILSINCKLLIGLRLEKSDVRLGFFRIGVTIASFQLEGKSPWRR